MSQHLSTRSPTSQRPRSVLVTIVGVFTVLEGIAILLGAAGIALLGAGALGLAGFATKGLEQAGIQDPGFAKAAGDVSGPVLGVFLCVTLVVWVIGSIVFGAGLSVLKRRGRVGATGWALLGIVLSGLALASAVNSAGANPFEGGLNNRFLIDGGWLAYALVKLIVLALAGKEFQTSIPTSQPRPASI